jgi:hypothetical protein
VGSQLAGFTAAAITQFGTFDFDLFDAGVCVVVAVPNPGDDADAKPLHFIGICNQWYYVPPHLLEPAVKVAVYGSSAVAVISLLRVSARVVAYPFR